MTTLKSPINGICLPDAWYTKAVKSSSPYGFINSLSVCPYTLRFVLKASSGFETASAMAFDFAGRGKVGWGGCPGSDVYVQGTNGIIDVWKAYTDGVWSSSVTVKVYAWNLYPTLRMYANGSITNKTITAVATSGCPVDLVATATVYDDGTVSLA